MGKPDADGPGLPDLPPEWGRVVVPDDASALAAEAEEIRRELRERVRVEAQRRVPRRRPARWAATRSPLALPILILLVALLTTIAGLFAVTWHRPARTGPVPPNAAPYAPPADLTGRPLPALDLVDADQSPVPLRGLIPALIVLVDDCACAEELADAATAAPPGVTVVTVDTDPAVRVPTPPSWADVRALADPAGGLRGFLQLPARPGVATAVLVDREGRVVRVVPEIRSADDYRAELSRLAR
ncbi:TlpA family protein disulfide reductase [Micromonospora endolithica]|uniref:Thioredoxin domain-containing protein n=1 Tax=Micromonospora endolithica TaxID=230091 RepID=A0A3A9YRW8_9ACTN|nr:hypothetical protein [Micromonospora endolithica]RKN38851.1 hypothetical protein D7223_29895 [Micromonospora endolithica]TWJ25476.1 hypothetical protein JD76_05647 [Micromonospora endolithica]